MSLLYKISAVRNAAERCSRQEDDNQKFLHVLFVIIDHKGRCYALVPDKDCEIK